MNHSPLSLPQQTRQAIRGCDLPSSWFWSCSAVPSIAHSELRTLILKSETGGPLKAQEIHRCLGNSLSCLSNLLKVMGHFGPYCSSVSAESIQQEAEGTGVWLSTHLQNIWDKDMVMLYFVKNMGLLGSGNMLKISLSTKVCTGGSIRRIFILFQKLLWNFGGIVRGTQ